jgi:hypothetical protein
VLAAIDLVFRGVEFDVYGGYTAKPYDWQAFTQYAFILNPAVGRGGVPCAAADYNPE